MAATRRARLEDLYAAIAEGDTAGVRRVLDRDPDLVGASQKTPPPLHWATYHNRPRVVELLLDAGADIGLPDPDRDATPLEYAVVYARRRIIRLLAARGADARSRLPVALKGAGGGFAEFAELPSRAEYEAVATLPGELPGQRVHRQRRQRAGDAATGKAGGAPGRREAGTPRPGRILPGKPARKAR